MAIKPATVEEYVAAAPEDRRAGLEELRRVVVAAALRDRGTQSL